MERHVEQLKKTIAAWDARGWPRPRLILVSGSGLAVDFDFRAGEQVPLAELLPFAAHRVEGHPHTAQLLFPEDDRPVLYYRGRLHSYQGYDALETVFPVRLGALLGARVLLMTNAAGGLRPDYRPGQIAAIRDHLNLMGLNPLRGEPPAEWGPRFPDLVDAYDPALRRLAREQAKALGIEIVEGVYAGLAGPSYETPAEVAMARTLGAELVGMSTVLEVIAARHLGLHCLCFSLVANLAAGVADHPVDHQEVLDAGRAAAQDVRRLLEALLRRSELYPD